MGLQRVRHDLATEQQQKVKSIFTGRQEECSLPPQPLAKLQVLTKKTDQRTSSQLSMSHTKCPKEVQTLHNCSTSELGTSMGIILESAETTAEGTQLSESKTRERGLFTANLFVSQPNFNCLTTTLCNQCCRRILKLSQDASRQRLGRPPSPALHPLPSSWGSGAAHGGGRWAEARPMPT